MVTWCRASRNNDAGDLIRSEWGVVHVANDNRVDIFGEERRLQRIVRVVARWNSNRWLFNSVLKQAII